ncbi:MAG: NAD(+)/NADH kinase [Candidatus Aenigmarchaeota archaeon]|nr:NAD(+)/NADH kinase [Candidatus Aenigmarchaeota archaeon]
MKTSDIVIVPKISKYEFDIRTYGATHEEIVAKYRREGVDVEVVLESHKRQKESLGRMRGYFGDNQFISREKLGKDIVRNTRFVVALGGDNHFQYVSHFVDSALMIGINSDPTTSEGALTYYRAADIEAILTRLENGDFNVEEWTRLEARVNGNLVALAMCEYFLGEAQRKNMSRNIIKLGDVKEEQKCSGLLVTTGAGSTGWYDSECKYLYPKGNRFPKTEKIARFLVTAPYTGKLNRPTVLEGAIREGEELTIHSLNDSNGVVTSDSLEEYEFGRGVHAVIKVSDNPLKVVRIHGCEHGR